MRATDNVRWSSANQQDAVGFDTGGGLSLKAESDTWNSTLSPNFNIRRFLIGEDLDAEEYGVKSQHQWMATEQFVAGANLDYVRNSTLTTELTDAGAQNQVANRSAVTAQPNFSYTLNERAAVNGSYLYTDVTFDTNANGQLVDYSFEQFSLGGTYVWRENVRLFVNGFASTFETSTPRGRTRTYGGQSGLEYQYRPDIGATLAVGYVTSDISFDVQTLAVDPGPPPRLVLLTRTDEASTNGPIASASFFKDFENTRTRFDYSRRVSPSIRGSQQLEDDIQFTAEHDLKKEWRIGFRGGYNLRASELQSVDLFTNQATTNQLNRDQAALSGWARYSITKELSVRAEYRFARSTFDESQQLDNVYTNALFMTFIYSAEPRFMRGL